VFEDTVKLKGWAKPKTKGVKKRGKMMPYRKHAGMRLQPHRNRMITSMCSRKFQVILCEENYPGTEGEQARPLSCRSCSRGESMQSGKDLLSGKEAKIQSLFRVPMSSKWEACSQKLILPCRV